MSFRTKKPDIEREEVPVEEESLSSAQEAVPVPLFWGKRKIPLRWISPIVEQEAIEIPTPGKK